MSVDIRKVRLQIASRRNFPRPVTVPVMMLFNCSLFDDASVTA